MSEPVCLYNLQRRDLKAFLVSLGAPAYTGNQVFRWLYGKRVGSAEEMTDLPSDFRRRLDAETVLQPLQPALKRVSIDGTIKYAWKTSPNESGKQGLAESVLIPMRKDAEDPSYTACLSTQVGCRMKCAFCATGVPAFQRNLTAGEIVGQLLGMERESGRVFHNVVIMGMGEPLDNYDAVHQAVEILNDPEGLNLGRRRVTLSTVGPLEALKRFTRDDWPASLALSLHSADPTKREKLIPAARSNPLDKIRKALRDYTFVRRLPVTLEYLLLGGVNDSPEDADLLAAFAQGLLCKVNLIRYNPVPGLPFQAPAEGTLSAFQDRLNSKGIRTLLRERKGADIEAACGQLGYALCPPPEAESAESTRPTGTNPAKAETIR